MAKSSLSFVMKPCSSIDDATLEGCAALFSQHYTAEPAARRGQRVKMSAARLKQQCLFDDHCGVSLAIDEGKSIGHCFFRCFSMTGLGDVCWVTQLVVHSDYRRQHIATRLIRQSLPIDCVGACLASSHPAAVKALEHATQADCLIGDDLLSIGRAVIEAACIPYVRPEMLALGPASSGNHHLRTGFPVDHVEVNQIVEAELAEGRWRLGGLAESDEFFALVRLIPRPSKRAKAHDDKE